MKIKKQVCLGIPVSIHAVLKRNALPTYPSA
jgi:hypothetical protein